MKCPCLDVSSILNIVAHKTSYAKKLSNAISSWLYTLEDSSEAGLLPVAWSAKTECWERYEDKIQQITQHPFGKLF